MQPEALYSQQGTKLTINNFSGNVLTSSIDLTSKLDYINIPIAIKYYVVEGFSLQAGPQIGFLISAKEKGEVTENGIEISAERDSKDEYEKVDFALFGGVGYDLPIGIFFQARYNAGITNINKDPESANIELTNNVFSFSVGYKF